MNPRPRVKFPIIVEGRYDKSTLLSTVDADVFTTGGFAIFNAKEKQALFRKIGQSGVILLTDSDGGGRQIRSFLSGLIPKDKLYHLYIPQIAGKEKRKTSPGKAGLLGVEGMKPEVLLSVLSPFLEDGLEKKAAELPPITKQDLFALGLSGGENSSQKRAKIAAAFSLPTDMSANSLLAALNLLTDRESFLQICSTLFDNL